MDSNTKSAFAGNDLLEIYSNVTGMTQSLGWGCFIKTWKRRFSNYDV